MGHRRADRPREGLRLVPAQTILLLHDKRCHHVQALAARGLAEGDEAECFQALLHLLRRCQDRLKRNIRGGVEIEHEPPWNGWMPRPIVPGMELDGGDLPGGDQSFYTVDLD